ncbi:hypothetical protein [Streptosporangium jomthongense]|uniref:Cysteine-rich CPCC domain-containing protein n=1 Tax=Streptosporangium jomthongense TaxID=1193683 RepID=A0ABV8F8W3_9ACTN
MVKIDCRTCGAHAEFPVSHVEANNKLLNQWWDDAHVGYDDADEHEQEITRASNRSWEF